MQKCYNKNVEINFGERVLFIMKKLNKKVLNSSLVIILALGLGGCAANSATTTHVQNNTRSAKVTKQSNSKKSTKANNKATSNSNKSVAASQSESTATSQEESSRATMTSQAITSTKSSTAVQQQSNTGVTNAASTSSTTSTANNTQKSSAPKAQQEIQLGLGEVASWTDSQGTTHHVDSDGMDRYTTKGNQEVQYQDWSGSLPQNATVNH